MSHEPTVRSGHKGPPPARAEDLDRPEQVEQSGLPPEDEETPRKTERHSSSGGRHYGGGFSFGP